MHLKPGTKIPLGYVMRQGWSVTCKVARCNRKGYNFLMIRSFAHKGLERFYQTGSKSGIQAKHATRLRLILSNLDQAEGPEDMNLPGLGLHELKGDREGIWAVKVSGNWRVTFRFVSRDAETVNYEDYH